MLLLANSSEYSTNAGPYPPPRQNLPAKLCSSWGESIDMHPHTCLLGQVLTWDCLCMLLPSHLLLLPAEIGQGWPKGF